MIVSKIDALKAVLYPEKGEGDKRPNINDNLFCCGKQTLFTKKKNNISTTANYFKEGKKLDRKWINNWAVT